MKSFLRNVVQRKDAGAGGLVGRTVKVGPYTVRVESHLADGGFASIYKVRDGSTGTAYALKHMRLMGEQEAITDCMTEVKTLKKLRDVPTVLTLRAAAFTGAKGSEQEAYLILDLCKDNLVEYVRDQDNKLSTSKIVQIFSAICQAVAAMHLQNPPLAHRDMKAENVLQHPSGDWVLCDFGSATDKVSTYESSDAVLMGEEVIRKYTTPAYRAPEMWDLYSREQIDTKADIWALGCLLYFLMFGKLAFQAEAKLQILKGEVHVPPTRPPPLVALLKELLVVNPLHRPDIIKTLRRLQEVADALNVDPTLLFPRSASPARTTGREELQAGPVLTRHSSGLSPPPQIPVPIPSPSQIPQLQLPAAAAGSQPLSTRRSNSFTRTSGPPLSSHCQSAPQASSSGTEGFANFEQAAAVLNPPGPSEEDTARFQSSPPKSHRAIFNRPRENSLQSGEWGASTSRAPDVAALKRQIADLQLHNQQLQATVRSQQTTIKQLQVDNYNQVLQLKRLGLDPVPSVITSTPSTTPEPGWANFDSPTSESGPGQSSIAPVRTPSSQQLDTPGSARGSPRKLSLSNGVRGRSQSPQPGAAAGSGAFDPFRIQGSGGATPSTDPGSAGGTPSGTASRQSALSAFAESLKQPALVGDPDGEGGSPLSAGKPQEGDRTFKLQKSLKRSHRRSSSEPVPLENCNLVEDH